MDTSILNKREDEYSKTITSSGITGLEAQKDNSSFLYTYIHVYI